MELCATDLAEVLAAAQAPLDEAAVKALHAAAAAGGARLPQRRHMLAASALFWGKPALAWPAAAEAGHEPVQAICTAT